MPPQQNREERAIAYAAALKERFQAGLLSELQPLKQWVVWEAEVDRQGKQKKVPYNPHARFAHASVTAPASWEPLPSR